MRLSELHVSSLLCALLSPGGRCSLDDQEKRAMNLPESGILFAGKFFATLLALRNGTASMAFFVRLLLLVLLNQDGHHGLSPNDTAPPVSCLAVSRLAGLSWTAGLDDGSDPNVCTNERATG